MEEQTTLSQREALNGHRAFCVWLTGLPASGKTTLACLLEGELTRRRYHCYVLDGDDLRRGLNSDLAFSPLARTENIRRAGHVSRLLVEAGLIVITSFISPYRSDRNRVRELYPPGRFLEVYLDCPLEICESRDPKGMYRKARQGEIRDFTGVSAPYEPPQAPDLVLQTGVLETGKCVEALLALCQGHVSLKARAELSPSPAR